MKNGERITTIYIKDSSEVDSVIFDPGVGNI